MSKLEQLASDIAMLSNQSLKNLADILARDYMTRAEVLEFAISASIEDTLRELQTRLADYDQQ